MNRIRLTAGLCAGSLLVLSQAISAQFSSSEIVETASSWESPSATQVEASAASSTSELQTAEGKGMIGVLLGESAGSARVESLIAGSPAEGAGIQPGDKIVSVNGHEVADMRALISVLGGLSAGSEVDLGIERDGWRKQITLVLADADDLDLPEDPEESGEIEDHDEIDEAPHHEHGLDALKDLGYVGDSEGTLFEIEDVELDDVSLDKVELEGIHVRLRDLGYLGGKGDAHAPTAPKKLKLHKLEEHESDEHHVGEHNSKEHVKVLHGPEGLKHLQGVQGHSELKILNSIPTLQKRMRVNGEPVHKNEVFLWSNKPLPEECGGACGDECNDCCKAEALKGLQFKKGDKEQGMAVWEIKTSDGQEDVVVMKNDGQGWFKFDGEDECPNCSKRKADKKSQANKPQRVVPFAIKSDGNGRLHGVLDKRNDQHDVRVFQGKPPVKAFSGRMQGRQSDPKAELDELRAELSALRAEIRELRAAIKGARR